jgi:hypothetical protein
VFFLIVAIAGLLVSSDGFKEGFVFEFILAYNLFKILFFLGQFVLGFAEGFVVLASRFCLLQILK